MNLLRAEWQRFFARRFTKAMLLVVLVLLGLIGAGVVASTHRPSPAAVAQAEQQATEARQTTARQRQVCEDEQNGRSGLVDADSPRLSDLPQGETCATAFDPARISADQYLPHSFSFAGETASLIEVFAALLALFGFAVGASFIGAERISGGIATLLLWEPRRVRLLLTKLGALLLGVTVSGVVVGAAWLAALWAVAATRGRTDGVTSGVLWSFGLLEARSVGFALTVSAVAFAIAALGRNTVAALATGIAYTVVVELGARQVLMIANVARPERWLLSSYVFAWLDKTEYYADFSRCTLTDGSCSPTYWSISMGTAAVVGAALLIVTVGAALLAFRRRDVT